MFQDPLAVTTDTLAPSRLLGWYPAVELADSDKDLTMAAELPGVEQADAHVELDGDVLTLRGERRIERIEGDKQKDFYLEERSYGAFRRSFTLPPNVDSEKITAAFDNGVLTLKMPKTNNAKPGARGIVIGAK